jgi:hypothetical protein
MPNSAQVARRGFVLLRNKSTGASTSADIAPSGAATFSKLLFGGIYDATFTAQNDSALVGMPPGEEAPLASNLNLTSTQSASWNLPVAMVSGTLTVNGGQMPSSVAVSRRGTLAFRNKLTGSSSSLDIAPTGAATFSTLLFGGSYDVAFTSQNDSSLVGLPVGASTQVAKGCVGAANCTASAADLSGTWTLIHEDTFGIWTLSLVEAAGALSGRYSGGSSSGNVQRGSRAGSSVELSLEGQFCDFEVRASVENGCVMSGVSDCIRFSRTSNFIGVR